MTQQLWVVTPVYFDVEAFTLLRARILDVIATRGDTQVKFVVVDDSAGNDPAIAGLRELDDVWLVEPPFNLGHQRAIVYGVRKLAGAVADEDVVVTMDADGEDQPEDMPRLVDAVSRTRGQGAALALRTKRREPLLFKIFYVFFRVYFRALTGNVVRTGNYAAYRGDLTRSILRHPHFDLCYSSAFLSLPLDLQFVPCERGSRYAGESRMSYPRLIMHGLSMLMPFTDRIAVRALLAFSATMAVGVALATVVVAIRVFTDRGVPGWATSTVLLLIILSFVALGNFVVLFTVFAQSRGVSLGDLEEFE